VSKYIIQINKLAFTFRDSAFFIICIWWPSLKKKKYIYIYIYFFTPIVLKIHKRCKCWCNCCLSRFIQLVNLYRIFRHLFFLHHFVRSINFLTPIAKERKRGMRNAVFPMSDYTSDYITVFYEKIANFKSLRVYQNKCTGNFTTRDNLMLIYILHTNNYYYNIIIKLIILRRCFCCRQLLPVSYVYVSCYMYTYLSLCALFVIPFLCLCNNIFLKIIGFLQE